MTDRQGENGLLSSGFDDVWGGGRLSMVKFDSDGMGHDDWLWETGSTFVESGQDTYVCINDCEPTSFPVHEIETVMMWKEPFVEAGSSSGADIVMVLEMGCGGGWEPGMPPHFIPYAADDSYDTKKRVYPYLGSIGVERCWRLRMHPWGPVSSNPWEYWQGIRKVYYATAMNHRASGQ